MADLHHRLPRRLRPGDHHRGIARQQVHQQEGEDRDDQQDRHGLGELPRELARARARQAAETTVPSAARRSGGGGYFCQTSQKRVK